MCTQCSATGSGSERPRAGPRQRLHAGRPPRCAAQLPARACAQSFRLCRALLVFRHAFHVTGIGDKAHSDSMCQSVSVDLLLRRASVEYSPSVARFKYNDALEAAPASRAALYR